MANWASGVCDANGVSIEYLRTGGRKPSVVALHGLTGSGACWTPLARALEAGFDVVMPDARGHGGSSAPAHGYRYDDLARDVIGLIDALGLETPVLLGHSMGGMTAALAASQLGTAIRGVVLADPTFLPPERQREVYESDVAAQHRALIALGKDEALAQARQRHPHRSPELLELIIDARLRTGVNAFEVLAPPNPDYRNPIAAVRVPTLLVTAQHGVVSREAAHELQALNPRLRHERIPDTGHALVYDKPDEFAALVRSFLQSLPAAKA